MDNFSNLPQIISMAAQSQLGIFALLSIALSVLAYTFFSAASEKVKVGIFAMLFAGVAGFGVAMFQEPKPEEMPLPSDDNSANVNAEETLRELKTANVDFSVREKDIKRWVNNKYTLYPVISIGLLKLLNGKRLAQPVYLDVIAYNYEHAEGAPAPSKVDPADPARLKAAVIEGYNERHGSMVGYVTDFKKLLR